MEYFSLIGKFRDSPILEQEAGLGRQHFVLIGQAFGLLVNGVLSENCFSSLSDKNSEKIKVIAKASKLDQREVCKVWGH
jgi:hypothetical protein